jgi:hypothetical protein
MPITSPIRMDKQGFVVHFESKGFYSDRQSTYEWCYTKDLSKAKVYKTVQGASNLVVRALSLYKDQPIPLIYKVNSKGLQNTTPVTLADVRPKKVKDLEKRAIPKENLIDFFSEVLKKV